MVGWRNYFDLKRAETGAHYVVLMENWRVESLSSSINFLFEQEWCRRAGEQEEGRVIAVFTQTQLLTDLDEVEWSAPAICAFRNTLQHKVGSWSGSPLLKCQKVDGWRQQGHNRSSGHFKSFEVKVDIRQIISLIDVFFMPLSFAAVLLFLLCCLLNLLCYKNIWLCNYFYYWLFCHLFLQLSSQLFSL